MATVVVDTEPTRDPTWNDEAAAQNEDAERAAALAMAALRALEDHVEEAKQQVRALRQCVCVSAARDPTAPDALARRHRLPKASSAPLQGTQASGGEGSETDTLVPARPSEMEDLESLAVRPEMSLPPTPTSISVLSPTARRTQRQDSLCSSLREEVWPAWNALETRFRSRATSNPSSFHLGASASSYRQKARERGRVVFQEMICSEGPIRHFILHPSAWQRMVWDALSLLVVSYDVLSLPLLAFSFDKLPVALAMRHVTTVFWTVDIIATFLTGYHEGGIVVGLPRKIAMRYLLSTFLMDVGIVCVDWVMMSSEINSSGSSDAVDIARLGKTIRIIRLLRILRLFRVLKLVDLSTKFGDLMMTFTMQSRAAFEFFGIFKLILMVTISNHFLACAWYAIGTSSPLEESWLQPLAPLQDQSAVYLYAISFHWSMSQFTPAPNNFHPMNMRERWFAIGVLLFGFTMFSSFLGSITSLLTHIRNSAVTRTEEDMRVREFLSQNRVSLQLGNRVVTYLRQKSIETKRRVLEADVRCFQDLPGSLHMELRFEVYSGVLADHPLFATLAVIQPALICDACDSIMSQRYLTRGHELFHTGVQCSSAFATLNPGLAYKWYTSPRDSQEIDIGVREWLCEAAVWIRWVHRGQATAMTQCTVATMSAEGFRQLARSHPIAFDLCRVYAQTFADRMGQESAESRVDIWCSKELASELTADALERAGPLGFPLAASEAEMVRSASSKGVGAERSFKGRRWSAQPQVWLARARDAVAGGPRPDYGNEERM